MKSLRLTCLLFVVVTGLCAALLTAQSSTATVTGTVKDASGAVLGSQRGSSLNQGS